MATASTNTVLDHTGDAGYRAWIAEIIAQLIAVGVTQTGDTGQVNTATVTRPAINTLNAYAVFRFNDTAHSTNPIFFKLDFGTGNAADRPQIRITVGRGSNGSGTINGLTMTRVGCNAGGSSPASTVTPYTSRFCYNATQGFLGMVWKIGGLSSELSHGGFYIFRSVDANGDPTTDSTHLIANNNSDSNGTSSSGCYMQVISHLTSTVYNTSPWPTLSWSTGGMPFGLTSTLYSADSQSIPVWQYTPVIGITNQIAVALRSEIAINSTVSHTILGSTAHTYIQVGPGLGVSSTWASGFSSSTHGILMLWE